jgi:tRNA modification GTPase
LSFDRPQALPGEDVVEYHVHGGAAVVQGIMNALATIQGHRMAQPGEFTRRAFENGKLDLTAAEAVADLIHAETESQRQQALLQMDGALYRLYEGWKERIAHLLALMEADLDFSDQDLPMI